jgi:hypothetical protein
MPGADAHNSIHKPWLNARRLRAQSIALAICLWSVYAWVLATPGLRDRNHLVKGTDFLHLYTLGSIAQSHLGSALYDTTAQTLLLAERVPEAAHTSYLPLYGPQVSLLFAPFAAVPYGVALAAWWLVTAAIYGLCVLAIWRTCPHLHEYGGLIGLLAVGYPAFFHLIAWGQTSALALACLTGTYLLLRSERWFAAGLVLGCLAFKPQLGLAMGCVFLLTRAWRVIIGALLTGTAQILVGWLYYGTATMQEYVRHTLQIPQVLAQLEPRIYQTHSLRTFWEMLIGWPGLALGLYAISALIVLALTVRCWTSSLPLGLRYSALLLASVLVSPHLTVYDLVILAPALLLTADWLVANPAAPFHNIIAILCYLIYLLPLIGPLARWTHAQLSVVAMAGLLWMLSKSVKTMNSDLSQI